MLSRRKRAAARWFKAMLKDQSPSRAMYAGFMAYGIELGIPSRVACGLAYSFVARGDASLNEVHAAFREEASKWT